MLITRPLAITPLKISLEAPPSVETETRFDVDWQGPGARYDAVQIWDPSARGGKGKVVQQKRVWSGDKGSQTVTLNAPKAAGEYELRYYNGDNKKVLLTQPLSVQ